MRMTNKITSREVLTYLNELGYNNINSQQLKEFVHDLRKLIKYEERKKFHNHYNVQEEKKRVKLNECDIPPLYLQETCASKAKVTEKKQSVISLQIKKSKCTKCCAQSKSQSTTAKTDETDNKENEVVNVEKKDEEIKPIENKKAKKVSARQRGSVIKPTASSINQKCDPVTLYHYYKNLWDQHKFPGEDNRNELRWAIREKLSQAPRMCKG